MMKASATLVFTAEELHVMAAAEGISHLMLFRSEEDGDRAEKIQAVCRLITDGFLIHENGKLKTAPMFSPFSRVMKETVHAVSIRASDECIPPVCLYYSNRSDCFLAIVPHQGKDNSFKMILCDSNQLKELLIDYGVLPAMEEDHSVDENMSEAAEWMNRLKELNWDFPDFLSARREPPFVWMDRFVSKGDKAERESSIVVARPIMAYQIAIHDLNEGRFCDYSLRYVVEWLKGLTV